MKSGALTWLLTRPRASSLLARRAHTHAGHPFVAGRLLQRLPELRITADISHWFLASERLFPCPPSPTSPAAARRGRQDNKEEEEEGSTSSNPEAQLMLLAAERTDHVR